MNVCEKNKTILEKNKTLENYKKKGSFEKE